MFGRMRRPTLVGAFGDEAIEAGVLGEDVGFFAEDVAEGVFIVGDRWRQGIWSARLEARGVEVVFGSIPLILVHTDGGLNKSLELWWMLHVSTYSLCGSNLRNSASCLTGVRIRST